MDVSFWSTSIKACINENIVLPIITSFKIYIITPITAAYLFYYKNYYMPYRFLLTKAY
jgi:hypothetical protein